MDKIPQKQTGEVENFKLTPEQENERDEMQELVNMMRISLNVDQNGAIIGKSDKDGKPEYPTQEQYEKALSEIGELKRKVEGKKINEKLISNLYRVILLGGKKFAEFLSADFKKQKKVVEETIEEMTKNDPGLQLEVLKKVGDQYGKKEIELAKTREAEEKEEFYYQE